MYGGTRNTNRELCGDASRSGRWFVKLWVARAIAEKEKSGNPGVVAGPNSRKKNSAVGGKKNP